MLIWIFCLDNLFDDGYATNASEEYCGTYWYYQLQESWMSVPAFCKWNNVKYGLFTRLNKWTINDWLIDCMVINTIVNSISVLWWPVHLSMLTWSSFNQYSSQYGTHKKQTINHGTVFGQDTWSLGKIHVKRSCLILN